jgi:hypothetical protein
VLTAGGHQVDGRLRRVCVLAARQLASCSTSLSRVSSPTYVGGPDGLIGELLAETRIGTTGSGWTRLSRRSEQELREAISHRLARDVVGLREG